jgi:hypothetical protein
LGRGNAVDVAQGFSQDGGDAECPGQHLRQPDVIRAGGIRPDEPRIPDLPRSDQVGLLGALDLAVDRRLRGAGPGRDLCPAELEIWITEQEREDLARLLGRYPAPGRGIAQRPAR